MAVNPAAYRLYAVYGNFFSSLFPYGKVIFSYLTSSQMIPPLLISFVPDFPPQQSECTTSAVEMFNFMQNIHCIFNLYERKIEELKKYNKSTSPSAARHKKEPVYLKTSSSVICDFISFYVIFKLTEISLQKTFKALTMSCLVLSHFMNCVMDSVVVKLLSSLSKLKLTCCCTAFSLCSQLKILLC